MTSSVCTACGTENRPGRRFCGQCGSALELGCPACGASNDPGDRFCGECGTALQDATARRVPANHHDAATTGSAVAERRLVTVLFADLVGFTTLSEHRDPEEVRDLLSQYFERCRTLIERYGGTIEKFIGDAVMAVWGTPVAREDDAERAVRTGLALTQAVALLGEEVGMPALRVRAGVLTGRAAVEVGAEGEGMVLGDTVNTASRIQSIAAPGTVLVDDVTRRASEAAVVYEDAGIHEVKGREQPVHTWVALRVVAGAGGHRRREGLEAPFVGRDRELATIIESFEATVEDGQARLVSVIGEAGSGKSRLQWEFFKYVDGIQKYVRWHQGRCLSYGEGVAYWALAEMVRARAGILEEEDSAAAREKLHAAVQEHVPDDRERRLVEPRLAHLLGLEQRSATDRADLFSGWRLFFERIAEKEPVVLVFEDLQWADSGLLDFIDYLLEWSAEFPLFMLSLGRPELLSARPSWTPTITLEPLHDDAMAEILGGLVPGLPEDLAAQIRRRSEGVPLYAVETVRMLLDRGLVAQEGARYVVTGDISDLEIPETLQALVAARLDNLEAGERALLQDAAVVGQSFTLATLAAVSGRPPSEVERQLTGLVAKQVLAYVDEPLSAERGQYVFLQALLRSVALSTLARRDRKVRHLAVARHLQDTWGEQAGEIAEVLASHYVAAAEAEPDAADAEAIQASACRTLAEAGRRALSLALGPEARKHFERASELASDLATHGRLLGDAGAAAAMTAELEDAVALFTRAAELLEQADLPREAAQIGGQAALAVQELGRLDEAWERISAAYAAVDGQDDEAMADLAEVRAGIAFMRADLVTAVEHADTALTIADRLRLGKVLVMALVTKANALAELGRPTESTALLTHAIKLGMELDLPSEVVRGYYNLADNMMAQGRFAEGHELLERGLELARRRGDRSGERRLLAQQLIALVALGHWDEAMSNTVALQELADIWAAQAIVSIPALLAARGDFEREKALVDSFSVGSWPALDHAAHICLAIAYRAEPGAGTLMIRAREEALALLDRGTSEMPAQVGELFDAAFAVGDIGTVNALLDAIAALKPGQLLPLLDAEATRARARLAAHSGDRDAADEYFRRAIGLFRELETPFYLARAQLQYAEMLASDDPEAQRLNEEAVATFEALEARPWLDRARALRPAVVTA